MRRFAKKQTNARSHSHNFIVARRRKRRQQHFSSEIVKRRRVECFKVFILGCAYRCHVHVFTHGFPFTLNIVFPSNRIPMR